MMIDQSHHRDIIRTYFVYTRLLRGLLTNEHNAETFQTTEIKSNKFNLFSTDLVWWSLCYMNAIQFRNNNNNNNKNNETMRFGTYIDIMERERPSERE